MQNDNWIQGTPLFLILFSEAINAIVLYSQSAEELLKRKKVFREVIFKYLAAKGVVVPPSSEKHQLVDRAKEYWCEQLKDNGSEEIYTKPDVQVRFIVHVL